MSEAVPPSVVGPASARLARMPKARWLLGVAWLVTAAGLAVLIPAVSAMGEDPTQLTRDPAAVAGEGPHVGAVSSLGAVIWAAGAAVCLFVFLLLRYLSRAPELGRFFLASAMLTLLLLFDDLYLLHEYVFPFGLGIPETLVMATYGALGLAYLVVYRETILRTDWVLLAIAIGCFALSVGADVLPSQASSVALFEDIAKLFGIITWVGYFVATGLGAVSALVGVPGAPRP